MKRTVGYALIFVSLLAMAACSGRGTSLSRTKYCSSKTDSEIPLEDSNFETTTKLDENTPFDPAEGLYEFNGAQVFFNEPNRDIRFLVNVTRNEQGDYNFTVECAGGKGLLPKMEPLIMGIPVVTDFQTVGNNILTRTVRVILEVGPQVPGWRNVEFIGDDDPIPGSPKTTYSSYPSNEAVFAKMKNSTVNHQIRARVVDQVTDDKTNETHDHDLRVKVSYQLKQ